MAGLAAPPVMPAATGSRRRVPAWGWLLPLLGVLLLALLVAAVRWTTIIDDAYIFFRYAANLAAGRGYVFNVGEAVEGATSVSWTVLLALVALTGADLAGVAVLLGAGLLGATIVLIWWAGWRGGMQPAATLLALVLLIVTPNVVPSMLMGLETGLYGLLLTAFVIVLAARPGRPLLVGLTGLALFLTRPEAAGLLLVVAIGLLAGWARHDRRAQLTIVGVWTAGVALVTGWRLLTFGDVVPNSVRAKSAWPALLADPVGTPARLQAGSSYLVEAALAAWPLVLCGLVGGLVLARRDGWAAFVAGATLALGGLAALANGGDWMPFHRLLTPYLGVVALLAAGGLDWLLARLPSPAPGGAWLVVLVAAAVALTPTLVRLPNARLFQADEWPQAACYQVSAQILRDHLPAEATLAPEAIGAVSYALPATRIFDFFGLTEPAIARHGAMPSPTFTFGKHDDAATMAARPDAFLFHSDETNHVARLSRHGYAEQYRTYRLSTPTCWLLVGVHTDRVAAVLEPLRRAFVVESVPTA